VVADPVLVPSAARRERAWPKFLWALGDDRTRRLVEDAHHAAVADVLAPLQRNGAFTRVGRRGRSRSTPTA
jgi:hypothetical protein